MAERELYVGYLGTPRSHMKVLRVAVPVTMWLLALIAGVISFSGPAWGGGAWDTSAEREWTGVVSVDPYPVLLTSDGAMIPVVEMGKRGAMDRLGTLSGRLVTLRGYELNRAGGRMIELAPDERGVEVLEQDLGESGSEPVETETFGEVELEGEVLDSKCFLGAMKPGEGIGHRSCAGLCIRGGIPPMLVTRTGDGGFDLYLLVNEDGSAANEILWSKAGAPVRVTGTLQRWGSTLRIAVSGVEGL